MKRLLGFGIAILSLAALAPNDALGQKKAGANKRADITDATPQQYALLATYKEMVGTIRSTTTNSIVLRVEYNHPVANSGAGYVNSAPNGNTNTGNRNNNNNNQAAHLRQEIQKLQRDQIALQRSTNPVQYQQRLIQLARDQQRLEIQLYRYQVQQTQHAQQQNLQAMRAKGANSKTDKDYIDFELPLLEKAAFRRLSLGVEYDDKGNVKDANPAAKGADGLPGFAAKLDDLTNGVPVKVYLSKAKPVDASAPKKKDADGAIIDAPLPNRPQVRMIVVLGDANAAEPPGNLKKKK